MSLSGALPLSAELEIVNERSGRDVVHVSNLSTVLLNLPYVFDATGKYSVHIKNVTDANSCSLVSSSPLYPLNVTVVLEPSVISLSQVDICVNEGILFDLAGFAPFQVSYMIFPSESPDDGKMESVTVDHFSKLKLVFSQPGIVRLVKICHGSSGNACCRDLNIEHVIHAIPTAKLNSGRDEMDVVRQGFYIYEL